MSTPEVHPHVTVALEGVAQPIKVDDGAVVLASTVVPYAAATVVLPLTADTALGALDPRADTRVIINAANTGHWQTT